MIGVDSFVVFCFGVIVLLFYLDIIELWYIYFLFMLCLVGGVFYMFVMKFFVLLLVLEKEFMCIVGIN